MKVRDLIEMLQNLHPEQDVIVNDDEEQWLSGIRWSDTYKAGRGAVSLCVLPKKLPLVGMWTIQHVDEFEDLRMRKHRGVLTEAETKRYTALYEFLRRPSR